MRTVAILLYPFLIMRFQPTITFEQYRSTCLAVAAAKPRRVKERSWKELLVLAIVCLAFGIAPQIPVARVPALSILAALVLLWILSKPLAKRFREKCLKAAYSEEQETLNDQVLTIEESGISCDKVDGQATSHHAWISFIKRIDTPDAFIFLPSPNSFVRVPKEMLTPSDRELVWHWSAIVPTVDPT